ncbi:hypothetical protein P8C59_002790 [Phyllachora maydis]|uniref:Nudix hydrolase domain-containing protein n=1 Tax=Phyllachora maydis TaxID=1825666 RepID=A0AAD9I0F2_9PEZI|nr:hypothetical protein P8C59_002790 [Phyllachora maydis]
MATDPHPHTSFSHPAALTRFFQPSRAFLAADSTGCDAVATGALVFSADGRRLLLVQRAAHDSMPLRWEVPGGACDAAADATVLHGLARELREETGLVLRRVVRALPRPAHVFATRRGLRVAKFYFHVHVDPAVPAVTLDPDEHVGFVWAAEDECRARSLVTPAGETVELVFTTPEQESLVLDAFRLRRDPS